MSHLKVNSSVCRQFSAPPRFHDMEVPADLSKDALSTISLHTANQAQIVKYNIREAVQTYKAHPTDTGSTSVQSK